MLKSGTRGLYAEGFWKELTDKRMTRQTTLEAIRELEAAVSKDAVDDLVVLYYSGHGRYAQGRDYYLVPIDRNPGGSPDEGDIPWSDIRRLAALPCRIVFIIDSSDSRTVPESRRVNPAPLASEVKRTGGSS